MTILITRPGLQTTIQARARVGLRHLGVPAAGPADPLSMALANRLVGNSSSTTALEMTLTGMGLRFESDTWFAIAGAPCAVELNNRPVEMFVSCHANAGDELEIGSAEQGVRAYLAVAGGLAASTLLGSRSTYLPAAFGGHKGRALEAGDIIGIGEFGRKLSEQTTPVEFRPPITASWALRACEGADVTLLDDENRSLLFDTNFSIGNRADRMGLQLDGEKLLVASNGRLPSAPVFPGCVQCPEDGSPYLLSVDAQTTGGYPQLAQIVRADRHAMGQLRPGAHLRLLPRSPEQAITELHDKLDYWRAWLPDIASVI